MHNRPVCSWVDALIFWPLIADENKFKKALFIYKSIFRLQLQCGTPVAEHCSRPGASKYFCPRAT